MSPSRPPTLPRDYRIVRVLGQGGMGVVYEAEHGPLGRRVALKVLVEGSDTDPTALARLRREALAMGSLQHPHIVQVSDFSEGPPPFLVLELLSGQSLRDRLRERGPMRPADACLVAVQLLSALGAAHRAGIVHRDVKPANVFVVETPVTNVFVKLLDFGVAKLLTPQGPALTSIDAIIGSAPYMAPEQIRGEGIDGKTDLFALGITLYEMLASRRPFVAATNESVMVAILRGGPIAPLVGVPRELEAVVLRALARSPSARYLTAEEMTAALMPFVPQADMAAVATTAMASRSPDSRTDVDTWRTATSVTPAFPPSDPSSPMLSPTFAQTIDQTAAVGGERGRPMAPQPRMVDYALPPQTGPAFRGHAHAPATMSSPGHIGMFVALGFVALLVLATAGGVAASMSGALPGVGLSSSAVFGSCVPMGSTSICNEFSAASNVAARSREISKSICTGDLAGKWSDGPCDRAGARFGCRSAGATSWFYAPLTAGEASARCPSTVGTVVTP